MAWFIGLMSGTSLDGVDAVLAEVSDNLGRTVAHTHAHHPFPAGLRAELLALNSAGTDELHRAALATNGLMGLYAQAVESVLKDSGVARSAVRALGAHGQTVRHRPGEFDGLGYTLQLCNGALLAETTGIDVICDFRTRDVAAGGQGAPLVPAFHAAQFGRAGQSRAVLNIGGIANVTLLHPDGQIGGFDTGPGNVLMDLWCLRHRGQPYDDGGQWAASGRIDPAWLEVCLAEPYFDRRPPKSTGRDLFHAEWLQARLPAAPSRVEDVMATLAALTARSAADAMRQHSQGEIDDLVVCGGGAYNRHVIALLQHEMGPGTRVQRSDALGVPPDQVEALAFAWLAAAFVARRPGNVTAVTGASGPRVLGALHPAG